MRSRKPVLDTRIFNMAPNLFGASAPPAKKAQADRDAPEFLELPETVPLPDGRIIATWPVVTQEAFSLTMDNYRVYVAHYNFRTRAENEQIDLHNKKVDAHYKANPARNPVDAKLVEMFMHRNPPRAHRFSRDYNQAVAEFCETNGPLIRMRRIQPVKVPTEQVFQNILYVYGQQLHKQSAEFMRLQVHTPRPLQEVRINAHKVTSLKRNGVKSLDFCTKTVKSHRHRLEECGVLTDYHFAGHCFPVHNQVNPSIMAVFDLKTDEITTLGNQRVSPEKAKVLPDFDMSSCTGSLKNQYQNKGNVNNSQDKEFAALTGKKFDFYRITPSKGAIPELPTPSENVKIPSPGPKTHQGGGPAGPPSLSDRLYGTVMHPQELAERLAAGEFAHYRPIDIRILIREAESGTLTSSEFRELVLQDFFKSAGKIYRNSTPYVGSWKLAINSYYETKFLTFKGATFSKTGLIPEIQQLRYRLEWARLWYSKHAVPPLFPNQYFDFNRQHRSEIGFEFTVKKWKAHESYMKNKGHREAKLARAATDRKRSINYTARCEREIRKFLRSKITLPQLLEYRDRNLPPDFIAKFPELLDKMTSQFLN